jgi:multidrug resistance efflux pump
VKRTGVVWGLAVAGVIVCLAIAAWYRYQDLNYVSTNYAWVNASSVWITAPATGRVTTVYHTVGARVRRGALLAVETTPSGGRLALYAPVGGRLGPVPVSPGSDVLAGTPLMAIVETATARVVAEIPETSAANVAVGDTVTVALDSDPGRTLTGTLVHIGRSTLATTSPLLSVTPFTKEVQYVPLTIQIPGGLPHPVIAGTTATVQIHI